MQTVRVPQVFVGMSSSTIRVIGVGSCGSQNTYSPDSDNRWMGSIAMTKGQVTRALVIAFPAKTPSQVSVLLVDVDVATA